MDPILGLGILTALSQSGKKKKRRAKGKKWPDVRHPPRRRMSLPKMEPMPPATPSDNGSPADDAKAADNHGDVHKTEITDTKGDDASPFGSFAKVVKQARAFRKRMSAAKPVEHHQDVQHTPRRDPRTRPAPARPTPGRNSSGDNGRRSVAQAQSVLRGLGWRGAGTTKGPVQKSMTDGLYGPATAGNWKQSARKRGLDPTFTRLGPRDVMVNPKTFAALSKLSGTVSGIHIP
jgi:hypothetical protein